MENTYTTGTPLNFKQAVKKILDYSRIEAEQNHKIIQSALDAATLQASNDHASIQALVDDLTSDTAITFAEISGGFDSDVMLSFAAASDTTDISTFTTATPLTSKQAVKLSLEIAQFQARQDHESLQAAIDAANDAIDVTDEWIKSNFDSDTVQIYTDRFEENFKVKPEVLLEILQDDENLGATFEGYTATLNENAISLSKDEADTYTFTIAEDSLTATGIIAEDTYTVDYKAKTITKVTA